MLNQRSMLQAAAIAATATLIALPGCGSNTSTSTQSTTPVPRPAATTAMQAEQNALPLAAAQPVPKTLKCKDEVVWVNLKRKTIHEPGDPYYGKTKNGSYMCKADALAAGDHMAGERHKRSGGTMNNTKPAPGPTSTY